MSQWTEIIEYSKDRLLAQIRAEFLKEMPKHGIYLRDFRVDLSAEDCIESRSIKFGLSFESTSIPSTIYAVDEVPISALVGLSNPEVEITNLFDCLVGFITSKLLENTTMESRRGFTRGWPVNADGSIVPVHVNNLCPNGYKNRISKTPKPKAGPKKQLRRVMRLQK